MTGWVHSIQSLGALDGPGLRFVVFMQGCPLRCQCCHNPDTWAREGGTTYTAEELVDRALRYRPYYGEKGGVTLSGGEPLLQGAFAEAFFRLCHEQGLNTCLDTSGCVLSEDVRALLAHTDRVLLDIKYTTEEKYRQHVGCGMEAPLHFLEYLNAQCIPVTLRQVIIPTLNDDEENILRLKEIAQSHACVDGVELLPFRKMCQTKYDAMGIMFPLAHVAEPGQAQMDELKKLLDCYAG